MLENKGYTKFLLKFALPLGSIYAQRCYELFRACVYETQPNVVQRVDLSEFRAKLDIADGKYSNFSMFRRRVLDIAEREINQKTDLFIRFKEVKMRGRGRMVDTIYVSVILKSHMVHEYDSYLVWQKDDLLDKLQAVVMSKKGQKISTNALEEFSQESIARLLYEVTNEKMNLSNINNVQKFFEYILSEWATDMGMNQVSME